MEIPMECECGGDLVYTTTCTDGESTCDVYTCAECEKEYYA